MGTTLFSCDGGHVVLPDPSLVLVSRQDGGNLVVMPPRVVWERSELSPVELTLWSYLVAATGRAMLDSLPQLEGGCINYWEAGNWALNDQAEPVGRKLAREHRQVHTHLLGRSREATDASWKWGEAPKFPNFADRHSWAAKNQRLRADECRMIVARVEETLKTRYGMRASQIIPTFVCAACGYPAPTEQNQPEKLCPACRQKQ